MKLIRRDSNALALCADWAWEVFSGNRFLICAAILLEDNEE